MVTLSEAYFLVRVGSWGEDELDDWIREQIDDAESASYDSGYEAGFNEGRAEGLEEGSELMYKQALDAVKSLV